MDPKVFPEEYAQLCVLTMGVMGIFQLCLGLLRMGWVVHFLSNPTLEGEQRCGVSGQVSGLWPLDRVRLGGSDRSYSPPATPALAKPPLRERGGGTMSLTAISPGQGRSQPRPVLKLTGGGRLTVPQRGLKQS